MLAAKQSSSGNHVATDFSDHPCYFWLNFFVVTSFNPYFVGKIARAFSLVRFECSKKVANLIFVKTSNGHNFCFGYQNRNYYMCIWGRKKFPTSWHLAISQMRSPSSKSGDSVKSFLFFKFYSLNFLNLPFLASIVRLWIFVWNFMCYLLIIL